MLKTVSELGWVRKATSDPQSQEDDNSVLCHFNVLLHLVLRRYCEKENSSNSSVKVSYEYRKIPILHERSYQYAPDASQKKEQRPQLKCHSLTASALPVICKQTDELLPSEDVYITTMNLVIEKALLLSTTTVSGSKLRLLDFAVQLMRTLLEHYPNHFSKTSFTTLLNAIQPEETHLFACHRQIVISLLRIAHFKNVFSLPECEIVLHRFRLPQKVLQDQQVEKIRTVTAMINSFAQQRLEKQTSDELLKHMRDLSRWQEFDCIDAFNEYCNAIELLYEIWGKNPVIVNTELVEMMDSLLFPNGFFFGNDRLPDLKERRHSLTLTYINTLFGMYTAYLKCNKMGSAPCSIDFSGDVMELSFPQNKQQSRKYLKHILFTLKKSHQSRAFDGKEESFLQFCKKIVEFLEQEYKKETVGLIALIEELIDVFVLHEPQRYDISQNIALIDRLFEISKNNTKHKPLLISKLFQVIISTKIIGKTAPGTAKTILKWLYLFNNIEELMRNKLIGQIRKISIFNRTAPDSLYNELPFYIRQHIV